MILTTWNKFYAFGICAHLQDFFFDLSQLYYWRIKCNVQLFIWKHNVYKQMSRSIVLGKENALGAIGGGESVELIKSLI